MKWSPVLHTFLEQHPILNYPGRETITAGLGPVEQYGITLLVLVIVGIIIYIKRKNRKKKHPNIHN